MKKRKYKYNSERNLKKEKNKKKVMNIGNEKNCIY